MLHLHAALFRVSSVLHSPFVVPQEGIIDLDPPDPDRCLWRKWDTTGLDLAAYLLHMAHVCFPLLNNGDDFPCSLLCGVPPHVYIMEPLDKTMLDDVALETCYVSLSTSWYPPVQASAG